MLDIDEQLSAMVQGAIESGCLLSVQPRAVSELLHQARTWKDEAEKQRAEVERLRGILTGLATDCSARNIRHALQALGMIV